jgi:hypothetical protein
MIEDHEKRISKIESFLKGSSGMPRKIRSKHISITDLLIELKESGFFNKPRFLGEIVSKLAEKEHHYSITSLTAPLQRAIQNRIIGRIPKGGQWAYVAR